MQTKRIIQLALAGGVGLFILTPTSPYSASDPPPTYSTGIVRETVVDQSKSGLRRSLDWLLSVQVAGRLRWLGIL